MDHVLIPSIEPSSANTWETNDLVHDNTTILQLLRFTVVIGSRSVMVRAIGL